MDRRKIFLVFCALAGLGFVSMLNGQGKKTIRELGISTITVHEYFLGEGVDKPLVESVEHFNQEGDLTEIREMNRRGEVTRWERYGYDDQGRLVEEVFLNPKGDTVRREKTIYRDDLRVEKEFYDNRGRLFKRKEYLYEYRSEQ